MTNTLTAIERVEELRQRVKAGEKVDARTLAEAEAAATIERLQFEGERERELQRVEQERQQRIADYRAEVAELYGKEHAQLEKAEQAMKKAVRRYIEEYAAWRKHAFELLKRVKQVDPDKAEFDWFATIGFSGKVDTGEHVLVEPPPLIAAAGYRSEFDKQIDQLVYEARKEGLYV